uniref:PiggyBac transposable element-derived protein domain-containing protein n=1 Tax=Amphimedon queenslandica TaxID=400682 RepID=A0A1X7UGY4_AMPQE
MTKKPHKWGLKSWGLKSWALADSSNGYLSNFRIYTGKTDSATEKGLGYKAVTDLVTPYRNGDTMYILTTVIPHLT